MVNKAYFEETKKFMWDGEAYETDEAAAAVAQGYEDKGFEVRKIPQDGKLFLYTRREVTEVVVDG